MLPQARIGVPTGFFDAGACRLFQLKFSVFARLVVESSATRRSGWFEFDQDQ